MWTPVQQQEMDPLDVKVDVIIKEEKLDDGSVVVPQKQEAVELKFDIDQINPEEYLQIKCEEIHGNVSNIVKTDPNNSSPFHNPEKIEVAVPSSTPCGQLAKNEDSFILPDIDSAQNYYYGSTSSASVEQNNNNGQVLRKIVEDDYEEADYEENDNDDDLMTEDPLHLSEFAPDEATVEPNQAGGSSTANLKDWPTKIKYYRGTLPYKITWMGTWTKFECIICLRQFYCCDKIREHLRAEHHEDSSLRCDCCYEIFDNATLIKNHVCDPRKSSRAIAFRYCGQGQYVYRKKWKYEKTTDSGTIGNGRSCYKCLTCGCVYRRLLAIFEHVRRVHSGAVTCDVCKRSFDDEENLDRHRCIVANTTVRWRTSFTDCGDGKLVFYGKWPVHLDGHYYVCDTCGVMNKLKERMGVHINTVHESRTKYPCGRCPKSFATLKSINAHMKSHEKKAVKVRKRS